MMQRLNGTRPLARYEIASGSTIKSGNLVALTGDGKAVPAADTDGLRVIGAANWLPPEPGCDRLSQAWSRYAAFRGMRHEYARSKRRAAP